MAVVVCVLAACSGSGDSASPTTAPAVDVNMVVLSDNPRTDTAPAADPELAGATTLPLGVDLLAAIAADAGDSENVVVSPTSIAIALAMLEPGAVGDARDQLRDLLRIDEAEAYHPSMGALIASLVGREADEALNEGEEPGEVHVQIADSAYLQDGYPFRSEYLEDIATYYGPVLYSVDFEANPDAVAHQINRDVANDTNNLIVDPVPDGVLTTETVLALVNALYLNASWFDTFDESATSDGDFTRLDSTTVSVPLMHGYSDSSASGDGWVAASKSYVGDLAVQFVLPDEGGFDEVAGELPDILDEFDRRAVSGAELALPRFETRFTGALDPVLEELGLTAPYESNGPLLGIADDESLALQSVLHQTYLSMDEEGTEAAAATVISVQATSGHIDPPVPVILDRPFLFRIFDRDTGATLFLGRILDPTA